MKKIKRSKELISEIEKKYYNQEKSAIQTAREIGIHTDVVRDVLENNLYGIRDRKKAGEIRSKNRLGFNITEEKIEKMKAGFKQQVLNGEMNEKLSPHKQGERNLHAKLTEKEVLSIREEYPLLLTKGLGKRQAQIDLSHKYKVSKSTISSIVRRATWKHI